MSIDRRRFSLKRGKKSIKTHCGYCGESTYIERMSGRDACSFCGAGVDEVFEEEVDLSLYEEHAAAVIETTITAMDPTKEAFEAEKAYEKKVATQLLSSQIAVTGQIGDRPVAKQYREKRKSGSGISSQKFFAGAILVMFMLVMVQGLGFTNTFRVTETPQYPTDQTIPMVAAGLCIDLVDGLTGEHNNYEAFLEVYDTSMDLQYMFMLKNTALFSLRLYNNSVYEVWIYPYLNDTCFVDAFKAVEGETKLIIFPYY